MKVKRLGTELDVFYNDGTKQVAWFPEEITRPKYLDWVKKYDPLNFDKIKKVRVFKISDLNYSNCGTYRRENKK